MIGIVLVTHGRLAAEFRAALEHVVGPQKQIESIAIGPDDESATRGGRTGRVRSSDALCNYFSAAGQMIR